jgi:hypothetical protein
VLGSRAVVTAAFWGIGKVESAVEKEHWTIGNDGVSRHPGFHEFVSYRECFDI